MPNFAAQTNRMLQSMTGFGKAEEVLSDQKITIQIKSLNSKYSDVHLKLPNDFRDKELHFRKTISDRLGRGKIEMQLSIDQKEGTTAYKINQEVFKRYYHDLKNIGEELNERESDLLAVVSKLPEVIEATESTLSEEDWAKVNTCLDQAIAELVNFRLKEGESLSADLENHVQSILTLLDEALKYDTERIEIVKERIQKNLEEAEQKEKIDQDRFEQELIYYLEKYDISEEKVRLKAHCNYFIEVLKGSAGQGRKLGFIGQEIGREINTLGSKANHAEMQRLVVQMKDALEKIKEQVLNVW